MWRALLKSRILNSLIIICYFIQSSSSQGGIKAIVTKHNLQSFTARAGFQKMLFDHNGLMYIASSEGIILYNGISEQFINQSESAGISIVSCMIEDKNGIIWIGCEDGQIYRIFNKELSKWSPQEGLPKHKISKMLFDNWNQLWIATQGEGVFVFNQKYLYHFGIEDGLKNLDINDMTYPFQNSILICNEAGIEMLSFKNEIKKVDDLPVSCFGEKDIIQNLELFKDEFYIYNLSTGDVIKKLPNDSCQAIWHNRKVEMMLTLKISNEFQILVSDKGLYIKSLVQDNFVEYKNDIDLDQIQSFSLDQYNTLWLLHKRKGLLSIYLPITQYDIPDKTIQDIVLSGDGKKMLLCTDTGLQIIDANDGKYLTSYFKGENLTSIYPDNGKDIYWIGSYGQGLIRFDFNTKNIKRYKKSDGLPDNNILQITGTNHYIWITTLAGILRIDNCGNGFSNLKTYNQDNGLPTNFIYQIVPDPTDRIWIGTDGNGINYLSKDSYCMEQMHNATSTHSIYNLEYNHNNLLYFNASGQGLGYYDINRESIVLIETPAKSFEYDCLSLLNDSVLLTAGNGFLMLSRLNQALTIIMDEEFGLTEILPSLNAIYKDRNDNILIGCKNSVIRVQTNVLSILNQPQNSFSSIKVSNKYIRPGIDSIFDYYDNQITFEFNAIHYLASDHLNYRYKLEGYDKDWVSSKEGNETFSNLSPGSYRFIVQSSIDKHYGNSNEIYYAFKVLNPFWKRWWFISACFIFLLFLFQYLMKRREAIKEKEQAIRRKTSELEFDILKSQVNPHFLFNSFNSVISLIEEDKDKAIEFTEKLSDYFRNILKYRDTDLIPLSEEMTTMLNYVELLKLRHPNQILFEKGDIQVNAWIPPMTLQLLMENAIKHNEISIRYPLKISIQCQADYLVFKNSIMKKRSNVDSTGFGLESLRLRYKLLTDKEIRIEKVNAYFSVEIPLLQK